MAIQASRHAVCVVHVVGLKYAVHEASVMRKNAHILFVLSCVKLSNSSHVRGVWRGEENVPH